jgi:hypothetical protein
MRFVFLQIKAGGLDDGLDAGLTPKKGAVNGCFILLKSRLYSFLDRLS